MAAIGPHDARLAIRARVVAHRRRRYRRGADDMALIDAGAGGRAAWRFATLRLTRENTSLRGQRLRLRATFSAARRSD